METFKIIKNLDAIWEQKAYRGDGTYVPLTDEYRDIIHGEYNNIKESEANGLDVEYSNTQIPIPLDELGMRALRTVFGDWDNLVAQCPDVSIPWNNNFSNKIKPESDGTEAVSGFEVIIDDDMFKETILPLIALHFWIRDNLEQYMPFTIEEVMGGDIENMEIRAWILSEARELDLTEYLTEVDTYVNERNNGVYTLFTGEIEGTPYHAVRCYCPSTDRRFFLPVEARFTNAKDAIASLLRLPSGLHKYIEQIQRQGEKFVINWTISMDSDEFKAAREATKSDLQCLSGDDYFNLLVDET